MLESVWRDLRYATRSLLRARGFTVIVLVTLVAGVASVTAIFSYVNAAHFADLPYPDAKRIVAIGQTRGLHVPTLSPTAVRIARDESRSFERLAVFRTETATLVLAGEARNINVLQADTGFVPLMRLQAVIGRLPSREEIVANAGVAAIGHRLWRSQFGSDSAALGRTVSFMERDWQIVGVLPETWEYPHRTDVLAPLPPLPAVIPGSMQDSPEWGLLGKLRAGVTRDQVAAEMRMLSARVPRYTGVLARQRMLVANPEMLNRRAQSLMPFPALFVGMGLFVLLIACANVGNLFLARGAERRGEIAVRASLGASRARLVRELLGEAVVVGGAAAVLGTVASTLLVKLSWHSLPTENWPVWFQPAVDFRVLAFAFAALLLVVLAVGVSPALEGTRFDLADALKRGGGASGSTGQVIRSVSRGLVAQLALAVALFVCSALLVRAYGAVASVDLGYPAEEIAVARPWFNQQHHADPERRTAMLVQVADELREMPGVTHAAVAGRVWELRTARTVVKTEEEKARAMHDRRLIPDGDDSRGVALLPEPERLAVSDDYFAMLGLRVREGRTFMPDDNAGSAGVAVVSASLARQFWPNGTAIGHTLQNGRDGEPMAIVGVVDDVKYLNFGASDAPSQTALPQLSYYVSVRQATSGYPALHARGSGDVGALRALMIGRLRAVDPAFTFFREATMASSVETSLRVLRMFGGLIGFFAIVALFLSVIGVYGVVAFGVARRVREIGVRIALGGTSRAVLLHVMRGTGRVMAIGLVLGLGLAAVVSRFISTFLFGVSPLDPLAYAAVCVVFAVVASMSAYLPARKATRVDPLVALRAE